MTCHLVVCLSQKTMWALSFFSGGGGSVTNCILFCSTPELGALAPFVFEVCGPFIPVECGHGIDFVLASPCVPRVPVFLVFHVLLCSKCCERSSR